jgi:alpha-L-rhamnosidase
MYGTVRSGWRIENETFHLEVTIPPNTTAMVQLPDGSSRDGSPGNHAFRVAWASRPSV